MSVTPAPRPFDPEAVALSLAAGPHREERLTHLEVVAGRQARAAVWPSWVHPAVKDAYLARGVAALWSHQQEAADLAWSGRDVIVATGTASGKSLAYAAPALSTIAASVERPGARGQCVIYLAPTKALAHDQLSSVTGLAVPGVRAATVDGDSSRDEREWARRHANYVLTNPDMLHRSMLPGHERWAGLLGSLRFVVVDEAHHYRGVFGAHVSQVLRRLLRLADHYGSRPTVVLASATVAEPAESAARLIGRDVEAVTEDGSPRGPTALALWEPPLTSAAGENGAPVRRPVAQEASDLVADLVAGGVRTLAFVRSRRGAETVAVRTRELLGEVDDDLARRVAPYRGGYLPEDRRTLEARLRDGDLLAIAATNALELGIDIDGLDAVVMAGFPGTRASMWQQVGRAGRTGGGGLGVLVARDDPLDTYLVHHPDVLLGRPVEATVFDPGNPYVLAPHLCAAAQELPLDEESWRWFAVPAREVAVSLVAAGYLRQRPGRLFWTRPDRAADLADIRGTGGSPVRIVEGSTGRLIGTVDAASAHGTVHEGAVYVHLGRTYVVQELDLAGSVAVVEPDDPGYTTTARETTDIRVLERAAEQAWGEAELCFGTVEVTSQTVAYLKRRTGSGQVLGEEPLDLPARTLTTRAVWWTLSADQVTASGVAERDVPGAAHAAEHASIGLLPLFATCDRWDVGGVSTALHEDTGRLTVFVHDGHPGGAGFTEHGFDVAAEWLHATREAIEACECSSGCPSCVQSPKCGNGNHPLDKHGAVALLGALLSAYG